MWQCVLRNDLPTSIATGLLNYIGSRPRGSSVWHSCPWESQFWCRFTVAMIDSYVASLQHFQWVRLCACRTRRLLCPPTHTPGFHPRRSEVYWFLRKYNFVNFEEAPAVTVVTNIHPVWRAQTQKLINVPQPPPDWQSMEEVRAK